MPEVSFPPAIQRAIDAESWRLAENHEQMCRKAYRDWLRPRLRWLVDHPRLLKLYLRLPHKQVPILYVMSASPGTVVCELGPKR